jgi:hypothetical protein
LQVKVRRRGRNLKAAVVRAAGSAKGAGRVARHRRSFGDIAQDHGPCGDKGIIAYRYPGTDRCPGADPHVPVDCHLRRDAAKANTTTDAEIGYRIQNNERMGEIAEIEFILEYFSRIAYVWSVRAQAVFAVVILTVFVISLFAVVRMF